MATTRYPIRIGARSRLFLRVAFGVTPDRAWAEISDEAVTSGSAGSGSRRPLANVDALADRGAVARGSPRSASG